MGRDLQKEYDSAQQSYGKAVKRFDNDRQVGPRKCRDLIIRARAAEGEEGMFGNSFNCPSMGLYRSRLRLPFMAEDRTDTQGAVSQLLDQFDFVLENSRLSPHALVTADKRYRNAGQRIDARRDVEMRVLGYASYKSSYATDINFTNVNYQQPASRSGATSRGLFSHHESQSTPFP